MKKGSPKEMMMLMGLGMPKGAMKSESKGDKKPDMRGKTKKGC